MTLMTHRKSYMVIIDPNSYEKFAWGAWGSMQYGCGTL